MERKPHTPGRRAFLARLGGLGAALWLGPGLAAGPGPIITRSIPASGKILPVIGMGTWITFDVGSDTTELATRVAILRTFFARGRPLPDWAAEIGCVDAVALLSLFARQWLLPRINASRDAGLVGDVAAMTRFRSLHRLGMAVNAVQMLGACRT